MVSENCCSNCCSKLELKIQDDEHVFAQYCSEYCSEIFRPRRNIEIPISIILKSVAETSNCDLDLLKMICRLLSWYCVTKLESPSETPTERECTENADAINREDGIISCWSSFIELEHHIDSQSLEWKESLRLALSSILPLLPAEIIAKHPITLDEGLEIAARINVNSYGCIDETSGCSLGFAIFPFIGATVNHDCYPNCIYYFSNGSLCCKTISLISEGAELTVAYTDIFSTTLERQHRIKEKRHFDCECKRCMSYKYCTSLGLTKGMEMIFDDSMGLKECMFDGYYCCRCGNIWQKFNSKYLFIHCQYCPPHVGPAGVVVFCESQNSSRTISDDKISDYKVICLLCKTEVTIYLEG